MRSAMLKLGIRPDIVDEIIPLDRKHDTVLWQHRTATDYGGMIMKEQYETGHIAHFGRMPNHQRRRTVAEPVSDAIGTTHSPPSFDIQDPVGGKSKLLL